MLCGADVSKSYFQESTTDDELRSRILLPVDEFFTRLSLLLLLPSMARTITLLVVSLNRAVECKSSCDRF